MPKIIVVSLFLAAAAQAQDTRNVTEPVIPPGCAVLSANLAAAGGKTLAATDETRPDTQRIQQALDSCPQGRAVVLKAAAGRNAFLSGPLDLREGVALVVDGGATLFGSRNPRDYDVRPGSCGIVDQNGKGCRALINGAGVAHAAVMGGGVIDGRGWAALTGSKIA
ncbi:MAG: glycoside hydrolase, partial [Acidobacteriia bacterium]|nr:glycoside hydrolase [Terriglobia bacterium]